MPLRMMDQTKAFPKKSHIDQYKPLIDAALNASLGEDGLPKVAIEDFANAILAAKAANVIRTFSSANNHNLWVSCPPNSKSVYVYKSNKPRRTRTNNHVAPSTEPEAPKAPEAPTA
jgi:hypothetical protein